LLWRESPEPAVWIGAAIVAAAGVYIARREMALGRSAH
jgi:drug/metabolite transporter (DMT)-like permease